eukprot:1029829-Prorocentrum_minimum.AAC.2
MLAHSLSLFCSVLRVVSGVGAPGGRRASASLQLRERSEASLVQALRVPRGGDGLHGLWEPRAVARVA